MTEAKLSSACLKRLKNHLENSVIFKHNDSFTSGIPDASITWKICLWLEFKFGNRPKWQNELQRLTAIRLAVAGECWVIFYQMEPKLTHIIQPKNIQMDGAFVPHLTSNGWNHIFVIQFIRGLAC